MSDLPAGPFGAILADPPWAFKTFSGKTGTPHRSTNDHCVTTETTRLADIPVASVAARDCALFMWTVDSHVVQAIDLARSWGFGFKTIAFVWAKTNANGTFRIGMGYWSRKQTETCLLFTRGKPKRIGKGVRQLIVAPRAFPQAGRAVRAYRGAGRRAVFGDVRPAMAAGVELLGQ